MDYACDRAVKTGDYSFKELAEEIQFSTTVTKADVVAVLTAAKEYIKKGLLAGQRVVLDEFGSLRVSLKRRQLPGLCQLFIFVRLFFCTFAADL